MTMALKLSYRNSFIEAETEEPSKLRRAHSAPEVSRREDPGEAERELYVTQLGEKLTFGEWKQPLPEQPLCEPKSLDFSSLGSRGHPETCHRPCIYFQSGLCENGSACIFCHETHDRLAKLDKKQRALLQQAGYEECVTLLLQFIRPRIEGCGAASELLRLLEDIAQDATGSSIPVRERRSLRKALAQMSLSSLVGLLRKRSNMEPSPPAISFECIDAAMEKIRWSQPRSPQ